MKSTSFSFDLSHLTDEELEELLYLLKEEDEYKKYNRVEDFSPYPYQQQFFNASSKYKRRFLMAANRIGKTFSAALEMSYHLTGDYPEWWTGHRFDKPIIAWAVGITGDSTRKVMQKELLGTVSAKIHSEVGTGAIPRDYIDIDTMERDGHIAKVVKIKHVSGGLSTLEFRSTQQGEHTLMGSTVDYIWLDEEDAHKSEEIYSQCVTRTSTTGGLVTITATPENGRTKLVALFQEDESGYLYLQNATWDDAKHLTEEVKKELLAAIPEWQHEMRTKGIPLHGGKLIFPFPQSSIEVSTVDINNWDEILWSLDLGRTNDETVLSLCVKKNIEGKDYYYVANQWTLGDDNGVNKRGPEYVAEIINNHLYKQAPVIMPHDGGKEGSEGYGDVLRRHGCNVAAKTFYNPSLASSNAVNPTTSYYNSVEAGLWQMELRFKDSTLKVSKSCVNFFKEMTSYVRLDNGKRTKPDHHIDSARYGIMSLIGGRGQLASECQTVDNSWNNGHTW